MINIKITKENDFVKEVIIKGHSGYDEIGKDIVCASVSSIATTTLNAIIRLDSDLVDYKSQDGFLEIKLKKNDRVINILMNNMIDLFKDLVEDYPKNIKIN